MTPVPTTERRASDRAASDEGQTDKHTHTLIDGQMDRHKGERSIQTSWPIYMHLCTKCVLIYGMADWLDGWLVGWLDLVGWSAGKPMDTADKRTGRQTDRQTAGLLDGWLALIGWGAGRLLEIYTRQTDMQSFEQTDMHRGVLFL